MFLTIPGSCGLHLEYWVKNLLHEQVGQKPAVEQDQSTSWRRVGVLGLREKVKILWISCWFNSPEFATTLKSPLSYSVSHRNTSPHLCSSLTSFFPQFWLNNYLERQIPLKPLVVWLLGWTNLTVLHKHTPSVSNTKVTAIWCTTWQDIGFPDERWWPGCWKEWTFLFNGFGNLI